MRRPWVMGSRGREARGQHPGVDIEQWATKKEPENRRGMDESRKGYRLGEPQKVRSHPVPAKGPPRVRQSLMGGSVPENGE
ncbi:MAG TPA: hypothetical protein VGB26_12290 [Nitrospiria bacterium]